jgi:hypothetical protein
MPQRLSRSDFHRWAETQPGRFERVDGTPIAMAPERWVHARLKAHIWRALDREIRTAGLRCEAAPDGMTVEIDKDTDYEPDALVNCVAFHPTRLDDTIHTALREKYGDQLLKLQRGGPESLPIFEELFKSSCPKFISPTPPDFDNPELNVDPLDHHLAIFMDEVKTNMWSPTVKSYLRLYTTMDLKKLAGFLEVEPEKLRGWLLVNKQRSRQIRWTENGLLDGEVVISNDLDYAMQGVSDACSGVYAWSAADYTIGPDPYLRS